MPAAVALARAELMMLARDRTAAVTALVLPLALGLWIITDAPADTNFGSAGVLAAVQLLGVVSFTVLMTATITLVARRQQRVLERWRTSGASPVSIVSGTLAPLGGLLAVQAGILFTATGFAAGGPVRPGLVVLAVVLVGVLGAAAAFVVAGVTRTVQAANVTTLPVMGALIGGGLWALIAGPAETSWLVRATGGGALVELVPIGWDGPTGATGLGAAAAAAIPSVLALSGLAATAVLVATRTFRWQARG